MSGPRTILFLTKQRSAASARYRCGVFAPMLARHGWTASLAAADDPGLTPTGLLEQCAAADVVVVARRMHPALSAGRLRSAARRLVFDFDDAVYATPQGPSWRRRRRFAALVGQCDQVWSGNTHLAEVARAWCDDVRVLPTSVDPARYQVHAARPSDTLDLAWIGSSSTRPYLEAIVGRLPTRVAGRPVRLKIIADFDLPPGPLPTVPVPWEGRTEAAALASCHAGLAPMPDDTWTRGKCGLKVLQYFAAGLPVIASDVPIHRTLLRGGEAGRLVGDAGQWSEAVRDLAEAPAAAEAMVAAGREQLSTRYSRAVVFQQMLAHLEALVPAGSGAVSRE